MCIKVCYISHLDKCTTFVWDGCGPIIRSALYIYIYRHGLLTLQTAYIDIYIYRYIYTYTDMYIYIDY